MALDFSGSALGAPVAQFSEFPTPTAASSPEGIAAGPDGNLWFAELNASKIGEISPVTHTISEFSTPTANSGPLGIALGPDGNMWFTEFAANQIGEINPITHAITEFKVPAPAVGGPIAIVAGPNGNVWFTEYFNPGYIAEINPVTHAFAEFPAPTANSGPFGITAGPDGNIWFTEKAGVGKIGEINPSTGTTADFPTPTATSAPNAIATGPAGTLWLTESATSKIGLFNPTTDTFSTEIATPTANSGPLVIAPGPDGNMWFTESASPGKVAFVNPITRLITELATPTASSAPVGITTGADDNMWFTESNVAGAKVGSVGAGAPPPLASAPTVGGTPQPGGQLTCGAASWSPWAGQQPALSEQGFDGYRWLRGGSPIPGAVSQSYSVATADVGQSIACEETVTYPLVATTVSAVSAPVTVSPILGASLVSTSTSGDTISVTISCQGLPTQTCNGGLVLTSHVTSRGPQTVAVAARSKGKKKKHLKPKITTVQTVASGLYSIATGRSATVTLAVNSTGRKLLDRFFRLPSTLTISGTASGTVSVALSYGRLHISPAYTWVFFKHYTYATRLTLTGLPSVAKVIARCDGHGCPFSQRTYPSPKHGMLKLASALERRHLSPGVTVELEITAPNDVGEIVIFTVKSDTAPSEAFRCVPPGAHRPTACS
jgi:streptogramin lyase